MKKLLYLLIPILFVSLVYSDMPNSLLFSDFKESDANTHKINYALQYLENNKQDIVFDIYDTLPTASDISVNQIALYNSGTDSRLYTYLGSSLLYIPFGILDGTHTWTGKHTFNNLVSVSSSVSISGYTKLGTNSPNVAYILLSTKTASVEGSQTTAAYSITASKIIGWVTKVYVDADTGIEPNESLAEAQYVVYHAAGAFNVILSAASSGSILDKDVTILVTYIE